jgi:hypothetical protein
MATIFFYLARLLVFEETLKYTNESGWFYVLLDAGIIRILKN